MRLLLVVLLAGCLGPTPEEQEKVQGHLLPPPDPSIVVQSPGAMGGGPLATAEFAVRVERLDAPEFAPEDAVLPLLRIVGRPLKQILPSGLPRVTQPGAFQWSSPDAVAAWPFEATLALPSDDATWLYAWIDRDGDAALSAGDPISAPVPPPSGVAADGPVVLRIDRAYRPSGAEQLAENGPEVVIIDANEDARSRVGVELLLAGYLPDEVSTLGLPDRPAPPTLRWMSGKDPLEWPVRVRLPPRGQSNIKLVAVMDLDANGVMSPGDLVGVPDCAGFPPVGAGTCSLFIDRPLPGPPN
jgi:hypothetical protein